MHLLPDDPHDDLLRHHVGPRGRVNPVPAPRYNLVVLGAGTAGLVSAAGAAGLGAKVALVERAFMGGDCLNVGCVPSKALIRSARAAADARNAQVFGVAAHPDLTVHFGAVMARMRRIRAGIAHHDSVERFERLGVDVFLGEGRFTGADTMDVEGARLRFSRAIIASGGRPGLPPVPGLADIDPLTNETVFALTALPRRLAVLGAGSIGCELAQAFARFGAEVTLVEAAPTVLGREDPEAVATIERVLIAEGITLLRACTVTRARRDGDERVLVCRQGDRQFDVRANAVLVATGRVPNVEHLGLAAAGVAFDTTQGVVVDDRLRTTNPRIYAVGDVASPFKFTHSADALARLAIQNALFHGRAKASALTIPRCTFTDPEVAHVGLTEADATHQHLAVRAFRHDLRDVDRAVLDDEADGFVKVLVRERGDRIAGATIVARHAGSLISEITLAMVGGLGLGVLARTIHPYPTQAEGIKRAADAYNRTRLTPTAKRWFTRWFEWTR